MNNQNTPDFFESADQKSINREIQNMLYYISFFDKDIPRVYPDGIYGEETENAVRIFQEQSGLEPTGRVNYETWVRIRERYLSLSEKNAAPIRISIFPSSLYETQTGETSGIVTVIQIILDELSVHLPIGAVERTGVNDEQTIEAVRKYQNIRNLPLTGMVDKRTWDALATDYEIFEKKSE